MAETALAESCNTYFADLAKRFSAEDLETRCVNQAFPMIRAPSPTPKAAN